MGSNLDALTTVFTEFYYWLTVALMFLIHVGFCMYEVGASRRRNHVHTLMKNSMLIPLVTITFFFFGWWIYWAFPNGPWITGGLLTVDAAANAPTSETMATNLSDRITGVFWAAFLLFSWTAASIVSGSVIERINSGAFWILAVLIGSVFWIIDAAWGWHYGGWMVQLLGYHDAYASGVIHAIAGGFALGVLVVLGPRLGKFAQDGTPRDILPHNPWLVCIGLFMIYTGFWGFYVACNVPIISPEGIGGPDFRRDLDSHDHIPDAHHAWRHNRELPHVAVRRDADRLHGIERQRVLDVFRRTRRHHNGVCGQRSVSSDPIIDHRRRRNLHRLQAALLG